MAVRWEGQYQIPGDAELLVNATSIGLYPDTDTLVPIDLKSLRPGLVVCDVIPNPPQTRLLQEARERGCTAIDGLGMLVNQGVIGSPVVRAGARPGDTAAEHLRTSFSDPTDAYQVHRGSRRSRCEMVSLPVPAATSSNTGNV